MWVVKNLDMGWDDIIGIFPESVSKESLEKRFNELYGEYIVVIKSSVYNSIEESVEDTL